MTDTDEQITYSFKDYKSIMDAIDEIARREGTNRSSLIRRALRAIIGASSTVANVTYCPAEEQSVEAAK